MNVSKTTGGIHDEATDDQVMESIADAVRDAANALKHAAVVENESFTETSIIGSIARVGYSGGYAMAFGIVYPAVFVTQFLPQDNPLMDGLSDGARAAIDAVTGTRSG